MKRDAARALAKERGAYGAELPKMLTVRGVAHVHSTYSFDGALNLRQLSRFLRESGIDFALMAEHIETLDPEKINDFIADCEKYSDGDFLLVPGIEIDDLNALFFGIQPVDAWSRIEDLARQLASAGALVAISHPVKVKAGLPPVTESLAEGVEVWNSRHDGKLAIDGRIVRFWLGLRKSLRRPLAPLCGIDFHNHHDFVPLVFEVTCERLDAREILATIRAGRYQILRSGKRVPLDFRSGRLALLYRLMSLLYRSLYVAVYRADRIMRRAGFKPPSSLRGLLRRAF